MIKSATLVPAFLVLIVALLVASTALSSMAYAQESSAELEATIRGALLSDPRTAGLSEAQVDAMVSLLAQEAQNQGVTSQDIQWRPQQYEDTGASMGEDYCGATPAFLCAFSLAFGFAGTDPTIPFTLGLASMGLIWVLAEMLHRHRP